MVNTHIGELAIHCEGRDYVFRPFFCRIAELGSPEEILQLFEQAQTVTDDGFIAAWRILNTLADDQDLDELLGYFERDESGLRYVAGKVPAQDIHVLGSAIIRDGIIGRPTKFELSKARSGAPVDGFDPAEYVAIGDAHLGGVNWWNKTMIELQKAIRAKNGPSKEEQTWMSADEIDKLYAMTGKKERVVSRGD